MRWEDERYVRWYTRNTPEWCVMSVEARGLFGLIMREVDRAGILELGRLGLKAVAVAVRGDWAKLEAPLKELLDDGCIRHRDDLRLLVIPNFVTAQEASASDKARQKASRDRARDLARAKSLGVTDAAQDVSVSSQNVTQPSRAVTAGHSVLSRAVPPQPSRAVPDQTRAAAAVRSEPVQKIADAILAEHVFEPLDADAIARGYEVQLFQRKQRVEWVLAAIADCALKSVGQDLRREALQAKLVGFMSHAKAPKFAPEVGEQQPTDRAPKPDRLPTPEESAKARVRMLKYEADTAAEKKRRDEIEARFAEGGPA